MSGENNSNATGKNEKGARGAGSFCVPRAAIHALLDAQASAHEIVSYLALARFTDASGCYSTAGISAIFRTTGANKTHGGSLDKALDRLQSIQARGVINGEQDGQETFVSGPILVTREDWFAQTGEIPPDGPSERSQVRYVLPDFGEPLSERVWFGNALVTGVADFSRPLKTLKDAGDIAARLLLSLYLNHDMDAYGGIRPSGPVGTTLFKAFNGYTEAKALQGGFSLHRSRRVNFVARFDHRVGGEDIEFRWNALQALEAAGFVYEVVTAFNRSAEFKKYSCGGIYECIPDDAEPLYELGARSSVGYAPDGEVGVGGELARLSGELGHPVTETNGKFNGTYAALVRTNFPVMIAGIYRMRFRVTNTKNAGVAGAWARIHENNRDAKRLIERARSANGLDASTQAGGSGARRAFFSSF